MRDLPSTWPLFAGNNLVNTEVFNILQMAPIPLFLVINRFEDDLRVDEIYERILSLDNQKIQQLSMLKISYAQLWSNAIKWTRNHT